MTSLISGRGVVKRYGDFTAVDGVDFDIAHGECFGFLGPNGAGKTSVMKMIQCLSPVTEGAITVGGLDVGSEAASVKGGLGVAPQEDSLDPDLTVEQNLQMFARYFSLPRSLAKQRATELLDFFHLAQKRNSSIREISGGMKRRLVIARALINDPRALILDEPTTGLDPVARREIWRRLQELKKSGVTMLLTTHYMEEAATLCDRVAMMDKGKIMAVGEPEALVREKVGNDVATLSLVSFSVEERERITQSVDQGEGRFDLSGDELTFYDHDIDRLAVKLQIDKERLTVRPANLEDLFYTLTGRGGLSGEA